ncbi:MAG: NFACT family protein [Deltaproteobacteria bacterium]|nr:NFACT family protein [Deltaproteobacteria bacterium]
MTLTLTELEAVTAEVSAAATGGKIRGLAVPEPFVVVLTIEGPSGRRRVLFCARPGLVRMHLTEIRLETPRDAVPAFAEPARRELLGAAIERVANRYHDRVVAFDLNTFAGPRTLLFEGSGHHPNLYVLGEDGRILLMLGPSHSHLRRLVPGSRYERPLPHQEGIEAVRFLGGLGSVSADVEAFYRAEDERARRRRYTPEPAPPGPPRRGPAPARRGPPRKPR